MSTPDETQYDLAVIGAGTAGLVASFLGATLGAKTLLIEKEKVGGECLWTGCVPSKTLIKSARVFDTIKRAEEFGVHVEQTRLVWGAVKMRIADVRDEIKALEREEIKRAGIEVLNGTARFEAPGVLQVATKAGETTVRARKFIIATGTKSRVPQIEGLVDSGFITHEQVYDFPYLPRTMTILGGGPIACELAQAFQRFGCKITILQKGERLLPKEDAEISAACQRLLEQEGVTIYLNVDVTRISRDDDAKHVEFRDADGNTQTVQGGELLVATGKEPHLDELNLEAVGVKSDDKGIIVDDHLRTSVANIWACGDVTGKFLFTHMAEYQAKVATQNALLPVKQKADYRVVPWTTFTDPEISHLGLSEEEAQSEHGVIKVFRQQFKTLDRAIIEGETTGFTKVVTSESGRVLGVHIIGPSAGELIHNWIPALRDGALIQEMAEAIHVYPTLSEIGHRAGNEFYREQLNSKPARWLLDKVVGERETES